MQIALTFSDTGYHSIVPFGIFYMGREAEMVRALGSSTVAAGSASNSGSAIAGLQKKMGELMKELRDATKDTSPGAKERLKLLQVQIQALQSQIQQLQSADAQKAALEQLKLQQDSAASAKRQSEPAAGSAAAERAKSKHSMVGSVVDTTA
ncbi:FlxA-like family protein [Rugamonas sp. DEMB1]|uniref:FlxA-like family protein n=1 Tax=Rugamonas sp. DEMB1 TaxID=3039386 RepID=UPI00244A37B4|nr:FlxA-like family protein [Rugamonas sp. DEMB1]WGG49488.1 FlxA-like family protein [Rugamonas sp. DEMB1]